MKLIEFSTSRRVTVAMVMVAVVAFGMVGFSRLAVNLLPDITYPTITVRTEYPGVAPLEIERLVSEPVEGLVGVVSNVVRVSSISRPGLSDVIVEFGWGTNMDFASLDIREKLDLVTLPRDAGKPVLLRFDPSLDPIMRVVFYGEGGLMELRRIAEERFRVELESLEGVAAVRVEGGLEEEIQVEVETTRLAHLGISIGQVTQRLDAENVNLTGGLLKDGEAEFLVRTLNEFKGVDEIREIIVAQVGGAPVKLEDVGRVYRGHKERDIVTRINGREGVQIAVFKEGDANTVQVSKAVKERLDTFLEENRELLGGSQVEIVFDQATFIEQAIDEVLNTGVLGGILAIIVLYLFLRDLKSTSIISLSIPISVVATFFLMFVSDVSLNIMSLGGLALGVGMLVDNSIVVLESVQRYRESGLSALEAARKGSSEVGQAVVGATMTTICVFLPIVFVEGVAGQLFRDQALTVTYSLVASLLVALMLIPMLSSLSLERTLGEADGREKELAVRGPAVVLSGLGALIGGVGRLQSLLLQPFYWVFDAIYGLPHRYYPGLLGWALHHRLLALLVFLLFSGLVLERVRHLGVELIPEMSQGEFLVDLEWQAGMPLDGTANQVAQIDAQVRDVERVEMAFALVGSSGESGGSAGEKKENLAQLHVRLVGGSTRAEETGAMERVRQLLAQVPGLEHKFSRPSYFSFRTPVEVEIKGYGLETLRLLAGEVAERLRQIPGLVDVKSSAEGGQPEVQVVFDRRRVAELGTNIQAIGELLRNKLQGDVATELARQDRRIDIRVRAVENERRRLEDLKQLVVSPVSYPVPVPLEAVAEVLRAGTVRFRPILMTTSTTVLGLLPMALGLGEGAEIRAPMAITVIGGLLVSTLLTLVVVPVVYTILDRGK